MDIILTKCRAALGFRVCGWKNGSNNERLIFQSKFAFTFSRRNSDFARPLLFASSPLKVTFNGRRRRHSAFRIICRCKRWTRSQSVTATLTVTLWRLYLQWHSVWGASKHLCKRQICPISPPRDEGNCPLSTAGSSIQSSIKELDIDRHCC